MIWSSVAVFWEAVEISIAETGLNEHLMVLYGYIGAVLMMTVIRDVAENLQSQGSGDAYRAGVEVAYVGLSAVVGCMLWKGKGSYNCRRSIDVIIMCKIAWNAEDNIHRKKIHR